VAELAKSIGFSKAYIYKFFDSKQAIGEVICANRLELIMTAVHRRSPMRPPPARKYVVSSGRSPRRKRTVFHDRKLYDIAAVAARENGLQQKGIQNTS
jgi:AcrR family transcriptional regulator